MRYMTAKAKMMVAGTVIGAAAAGLMAALIVSGRIGLAGILAVAALAALAGLTGLIVGLQMRVKLERHRVWMQGYKDGCESAMRPFRTAAAGFTVIQVEGKGL